LNPRDNDTMKLRFTKMHGAGNDFVMLDGVRQTLNLSAEQLRYLADRHWGIGADQILMVEPAQRADVDFRYRIFNADGSEVEQCGNGARCFVKFVHEIGLTDKPVIKVETAGGVIAPRLEADGSVTVDMGAPVFEAAKVPFDATGLVAQRQGAMEVWVLDTPADGAEVAVVSMGNPHAVILVSDLTNAPVTTLGPVIEHHPRFPNRVNVGFMQVVRRDQIRVRVWERGAGETLACGTGACAAAVSGMQRGLLDGDVHVHVQGGCLRIRWDATAASEPPPSVWLSGPAQTVFAGEIDL